MAASSSGRAWSQPQTWRPPWVMSRRSSSVGAQRTVAGLAPSPTLGLVDGALDRDHDVAEVKDLTRWHGESIDGRPHGGVLARMLGECGRRQQGEAEHIGRPILAHVLGVERGQLGVVRERQGDGAALRRTSRPHGRGQGGLTRIDGQQVRDVGAHDDLDDHGRSGLFKPPCAPQVGVTGARRSCWWDRRCVGGTSPAAVR